MKIRADKIILILAITVFVIIIICLISRTIKYQIKVESTLEQLPDNEIFTRVRVKNVSSVKITIKSVFSKLLGRSLVCLSDTTSPLRIRPNDSLEFGGSITIHSENREELLEETITVEIEEGTTEIIDSDNTDTILFEPEIIADFAPLPLTTPIVPSPTCNEFDSIGPVYESYSSLDPIIAPLPFRTITLYAGILDDGRRFTATTDFVMMWNADGTKDLTFGTNGIYADTGRQVYFALTDGANIYVFSEEQVTNNNFVEKLLPDGTVDLTYGVNGRYTDTNPAISQFFLKAIYLDNGSILAVSVRSSITPDVGSIYLLRPDGTPDPTFGTNGLRILRNASNEEIFPRDMEYHKPTGHIYILGLSLSADVEVYRFLSDGTLDLTYGVSGRFSIDRTDPLLDLCTNQPFYSISFTLGLDESIYLNMIGTELSNPNGGCSPVGNGSTGQIPFSRYLSILKLDSNGVIDATWATNGLYRDIISRPVSSITTMFQATPFSGWISTEDNSLTICTENTKINIDVNEQFFNILQLDENGQLMSGDQTIEIFQTAIGGQPILMTSLIPTGNGSFFYTRNDVYANPGFPGPEGFFNAGEICYPKITYGERSRPW